MKYVVALLLTSCVQWPGEGWHQFTTPCGLTIIQRDDSLINEDDVVEMERRVVQYVSQFEGDACPKLRNNLAHELDGSMTEYVPGRLAAGWAECWNRRLFYHKGLADKPWNTALWHEMIHIVQGCPDTGVPPDDVQHPNWIERDYYYLPTKLGLQ